MSLVQIKCENCNQNCLVEQRELNRGNGRFCSRKCSSIHRVANLIPPVPNVKCEYCKKLFYLSESKKKNSRSGLFFCSREHKDIAQRIGGIAAIQPDHYGDTNGNYRTIIFRNNGKEKKCERCGYDEHEAAIIVHHKDKNRQNNEVSNLEVLCANCHAIEHWSDK